MLRGAGDDAQLVEEFLHLATVLQGGARDAFSPLGAAYQNPVSV